MQVTDLTGLKEQITEIARGSPVGDRVEDVSVEAEDDGDGSPFLRIVLKMKKLDDLEVSEVEPLVVSIEDAVSSVDERFASVRFAEAA